MDEFPEKPKKDITKRLRTVNRDDSGSAYVDMICVEAAEEIERLRKAAAPFCAVESVIEKPRLINKSSDDFTPITMTFTVGQWKALRSALKPTD